LSAVLSDLGVMLCAMPHIARVDGLDELLDKQLAVVSRGQLLSLGMTDRAMQYRIRGAGPWQVLLPGVYLATTGVPSLSQKEMAALLYAGPGSLITGPMALMHYSIRGGSVVNDVIDVLVPARRQRLSTGFARVQRTARMPARTASDGPVRLVLVPRAVADTARRLTDLRDVRAVVADSVREPKAVAQMIKGALERGLARPPLPIRTISCEISLAGKV
jgi:hypothetical protein